MYKVELNHLKHIRYVWFLNIFISEFQKYEYHDLVC